SSLTPVSPLGRNHNGWNVYSATASFGYSTIALPVRSSLSSFSLEHLESDYDSTVATSLGYNHSGPKGSVYLLYTPSYVRRVRFTDLKSFNQSLNLTLSR